MSHIRRKIFYFRKKSFLLIMQKSNILCICAVYTYNTFTMKTDEFLALQGIPIKSSHFYTKIALKMLGQNLSFDGFAMARSVFIRALMKG